MEGMVVVEQEESGSVVSVFKEEGKKFTTPQIVRSQQGKAVKKRRKATEIWLNYVYTIPSRFYPFYLRTLSPSLVRHG